MNTISKIIQFGLFTSVITTSFFAFAADKKADRQSYRDAEVWRQIYEIHDDAARFIDANDLAMMRGVRACLCYRSNDSRCATSDRSTIEFETRFISVAGEKLSSKNFCAAIRDGMFKTMQQDLTEARVKLALIQPAIRSDQHELFILNPVSPESFREKISSPLTLVEGLEPLTRNEKQLVEKQLIAFRDKYCEKIEAVSISDCHARVKRDGARKLRSALEKFREWNKEDYAAIVDKNIFIASISGSELPADHFIPTLDSMIAQSQRRALEHKRVASPEDILKYRRAIPYTQALIDNRNDDGEFQREFTTMVKQANVSLAAKGALASIGVASAIMGCSLAAPGTVVPCRWIVGSSIGAFFIGESAYAHQKSLELFLSTYERSKRAESALDFFALENQVRHAIFLLPLNFF